MKDARILLKEGLERKVGDLLVDQLLITHQISQFTRIKLANPDKVKQIDAEEQKMKLLQTQTNTTCAMLEEVYEGVCRDLGEEIVSLKKVAKNEKVENKNDNTQKANEETKTEEKK